MSNTAKETGSERITAQNLTFAYGQDKTILNDISFSIKGKRVTALIGGNGCGKTTLFGVVSGFLKPYTGNICVDGTDVREIKRKDFARKVAVVNQYNTSPADITVRKLVSLGRTPHKRLMSFSDNAQDLESTARALQLTDTESLADMPVSSLSGGQKQRVWLAMALAQSTDILLLDEITTYLDIHYQLEILKLIRSLCDEQKMTIVMVLHDVNQVLKYCDDVIVMKQGKIIGSGTADEAVNESILKDAFDVEAKIENVHGSRLCLFDIEAKANPLGR